MSSSDKTKTSTEAAVASRRRFLQSAGAGASILAAVNSRPVLGHNMCGWSGWMSGNVSGAGSQVTCVQGKKPSHWRNKTVSHVDWSAANCMPKYRSVCQSEVNWGGYGYNWSSSSDMGNTGKTFKSCFGVDPTGGNAYDTLLEMCGRPKWTNTVEQLAVAAYLNACAGLYSDSITKDDIVNAYHAYKNGSYRGQPVSSYDISAYFLGTMV